jgi:hypothetical protein
MRGRSSSHARWRPDVAARRASALTVSDLVQLAAIAVGGAAGLLLVVGILFALGTSQ